MKFDRLANLPTTNCLIYIDKFRPLEITYEMTLEDQVDYNLYLFSKSQQAPPLVPGDFGNDLIARGGLFFLDRHSRIKLPESAVPSGPCSLDGLHCRSLVFWIVCIRPCCLGKSNPACDSLAC